MYPIYYLKYLALKDAHNKYIPVSTKEMANDLGISSQTVSRNLKKLADDGFIQREIHSAGQKVHIKEEGLEILSLELIDYKKIFEIEDKLEIHGKTVSGFGEGGYYINKPEYQNQFEEKLGFKAYPGTLNIKVDKKYIMNRKKMKQINSVKIDGFHDGNRTFGSAKCYFAQIENIDCAIIVPERTHHEEDFLEIIAPVQLRDELNLKDGTEITIFVSGKKIE